MNSVDLSELSLVHASFIRTLTNTPGWLKYIGDRKILTIEDAQKYLENGPLADYQEHGFGLWAMILEGRDEPIGICGLLQREYLDAPDLGFAILPEFEGKGYTKQACRIAIDRAVNEFGYDRLLAITLPSNGASIGVLRSVGFTTCKEIIREGEVLLVLEWCA